VMVNNYCIFFYIGGIVDHHCLEMLVCFVYIGGIVGHHCLEVILFFILVELLIITVGRWLFAKQAIISHLKKFKQWCSTIPPISTKQTITSNQWWSTIQPISTKQAVTIITV
jgi:hypothetical protein